ncbi:ketimine reductase mu-crystallin isoform X3 [Strongylocentrotus purpuratus]|nr:ketimine reductase mu-crystallin isoform X3 [Strongylocentrotus purpuratus]
MPVVSSADNIIATKIVAIFPNNAKNNLSSHMGTIILNDATTGVPRAVMDAEHITAMRTAAASAVATKYLARDGWQTLAILGAGSQAVAHLHALKHMTTIREVRVWTRSSEKCQAFAQKFDVKACETAQEAVTGADVIATCTSSHTPVLESSWLKPSAHINCVGACVPWAQELGAEVMKKAVVYTDNTPGAYKESGDIVHSKVTVFAEIGEVINGTKEAKRDEITVFKSQGVAVEDAVAAKLVYDKVSVLKDMKS